MGTIIDTFPDQPLDFYGAMRSSLFDNQIRRWIETQVIKDTIVNEDANLSELSQRLVDQYASLSTQDCAFIAAPPTPPPPPPNITHTGSGPFASVHNPIQLLDKAFLGCRPSIRTDDSRIILFVLIRCKTFPAISEASESCREDLPKFEPVDLTVKTLLEEGRRLANEQQQVMNFKLSEDYMKKTGSGPSLIGMSG